jgi:hypothetical protein
MTSPPSSFLGPRGSGFSIRYRTESTPFCAILFFNPCWGTGGTATASCRRCRRFWPGRSGPFSICPPFILSLIVISRWGRRIISFRGPFQEPIDLVVAVFWVLALAFSTSEQGSSGSLRCAAYSGECNYDYLRAVDQAPAGKVAIITHRELGSPFPEVMAASLQMIGGLPAFKDKIVSSVRSVDGSRAKRIS